MEAYDVERIKLMLTPVVQYTENTNLEGCLDAGFSYIELAVSYKDESLDFSCFDYVIESDREMCIAGVTVKSCYLNQDNFEALIDKALLVGASYIVLDTIGETSVSHVEELIKAGTAKCISGNIVILIENSYIYENGANYRNAFSEMKGLVKICESISASVPDSSVGICFNVGHANLVSANLKAEITDGAQWICLVHANDNDGRTDTKQIPYTFTTGRGVLSTDWYRVIGPLIMHDFDGCLCFDIAGTFARMPKQLHKNLSKMLLDMVEVWNAEFCFEEKLNHPDKQIILFGAGRMLSRFLEMWGDKYKPAFTVDNNKELWGKSVCGVEIKSPQDILTIPSEKRNVIICNMNYRPIGEQLEQMGIEYSCFRDTYYY